VFKENVSAELKKERAEARKARIKKVDDIFDKAKDQFKASAMGYDKQAELATEPTEGEW